MKSIGEALEAMMPAFRPTEVERVALLDADGRFLAEDVVASADSPPFDNSAMDGYAVRAADVAAATEEAPVALPVAGESRAGGPSPPALPAGAAVRIFTGAPMPSGADTVVMQEDTERAADSVRIRFAAPTGHHVRVEGEDLRHGEIALRRGAALGPGELALLASQRIAHVPTHRPPTVALVSTGDELREVDSPPEPGTIVASNAYALAAQVRRAGAVARVLPIAPDRVDAIVATLRDALRDDVVITTGGVSVGDYDHVHEAFERVGVRSSFWKVAIKPGKPLRFGIAGDTPVVGLPGNPVSAIITFDVFVRPGLRRMLGDPRPHRAALWVELGAATAHRPGRVELVRARLHAGERLLAYPHERQGSGSLTSTAGADALLVLPADRARFEAGEPIQALPLHDVGAPRAVFD